MKRRFSKKQKVATALVTGSSELNMEADHIKPFSKGGETKVENCQLIRPIANRTKSNNYPELWGWQNRFKAKWNERNLGKPFLLVACPGGGKTIASLSVADDWLRVHKERKLIVVVPSDNLRTQWSHVAAFEFGIELQTKDLGTNFKEGFQGGVTTYSALAVGNTDIYRKLCSIYPTMVILDEIHHCGERETFGVSVSESFSLSEEKLLLSGTPWRTKRNAIPFVEYDGQGLCVSHFSYSYLEGLRDGKLRTSVFHFHKGAVDHVSGWSEEFDEGISEVRAKKLLTKLIKPTKRGSFVEEQIREAHRKLVECRKINKDAAAVATCMDIEHARKVARVVRRVTGCDPTIIVSDGDVANETVKEFRDSSKEWLVSVRMVSEGTDIKRLQVLCYLTNITTELFFMQLVGRVLRRRGDSDNESYIYLMPDPRLQEYSSNMVNTSKKYLKELEKNSTESRSISKGNDRVDTSDYTSRHTGVSSVRIRGELYSEEEARLIAEVAESHGVGMETAVSIRNAFLKTNSINSGGMTKQERMDHLKSKIKGAVSRLANLEGDGSSEWIKKIHRRYSPRQMEMTEEQLQSKLDDLMECIREFD